VVDDVVSIELRAIAGVTYPLVDKGFAPDPAAGKLTEGITASKDRFLSKFPYLQNPRDGFDTP
jgi:hypothetical protein